MNLRFVLLLFCALSLGAADWPNFQHDARNSGVASEANIALPLKQAWTFQTGAAVRVQPVIKDGVAFFGSTDHKFYAVDTNTGKLKWQLFTDGEILCTASIYKNNVYFGSDDGYVYAANLESGELLWKKPVIRQAPPAMPIKDFQRTEQPLFPHWFKDSSMAMDGAAKVTSQVIRAPLLAAEDMVFVGTGRPGSWGHMHGYDADTGDLIWSRAGSVGNLYRTFSGVDDGPILFAGMLFWPDARIEAIHPRTGDLMEGWPEAKLYTTDGKAENFSNQIAVSEDGLAVVYADARHFPHSGRPPAYWIIDLATNAVRFNSLSRSTRAQHMQSPLIHGKRTYYVHMDPKVCPQPAVVCSDIESGAMLGMYRGEGFPLNGSLAMAGGILFAISEGGVIHAINPEPDGHGLELLWKHELKTSVLGTAAIASGKYYIGAEDGRLYAFSGGAEL